MNGPRSSMEANLSPLEGNVGKSNTDFKETE
jgi:hypothetical protein